MTGPIVHPSLIIIRLLDPTTGATTTENTTHIGSPNSFLNVSPDQTRLYLVDGGGPLLHRLDAQTQGLPEVDTFSFGTNHLPGFIAFSSDGTLFVFVTYYDLFPGPVTSWHLIVVTPDYAPVADLQPFVLTDPTGHREGQIEVNADGTRLYWGEINGAGTNGCVHVYDLVNHVALSDLVATPGERVFRITRDPLSTDLYLFLTNTGTLAGALARYTTAGVLVFRYDLIPSNSGDCFAIDMGLSPDGLSAWTTEGVSSLFADRLRQWRLSDGVMLQSFTDGVDGYGHVAVLAFAVPPIIITVLTIACASKQVTITGTGFPASPTVVLTGALGQPIPLTILSATSTEIVADVPSFATDGTYCVTVT